MEELASEIETYQRLYAEQGYLIIFSNKIRRIGERITMTRPTPINTALSKMAAWSVDAQATRRQWEDQEKVLDGDLDAPDGYLFYKIVALD